MIIYLLSEKSGKCLKNMEKMETLNPWKKQKNVVDKFMHPVPSDLLNAMEIFVLRVWPRLDWEFGMSGTHSKATKLQAGRTEGVAIYLISKANQKKAREKNAK